MGEQTQDVLCASEGCNNESEAACSVYLQVWLKRFVTRTTLFIPSAWRFNLEYEHGQPMPSCKIGVSPAELTEEPTYFAGK